MLSQEIALQTEKRQLRAVCNAKLQLLPPPDAAAATRLCAALCALPAYRRARTVFCFFSTPMEPPTHLFLQTALDDGKTVCLPWCAGHGVMYAKEIRSLTDLEPGVYAIPAPPASAQTVPPRAIDFAVLPCLAADTAGNRLGHGGGYYDRFLPKLSETAVCVLLCRKAMLLPVGQIPMGKYDLPIPCVLTEEA